MKKLKGNFRISKVSSNCEADYIEIRLTDENSRCQVVSIKTSVENFAKALFMTCEPCEYELNDEAPLGLYHENKTEVVTVTGSQYEVFLNV